jgi:hypothetical protein
MRERLLITTAIGLMLGAGAYAQSPSEQPRNSSPPAAQSQNNSNSSAPSASSSTPSSQSSTPSAQNTQSSPSASSRSQTTTSQSTPAAGSNDSSRSQAQSHQASPPSQARQDSNAAAPSQTQSALQPNSSSQAQTNTAPPANNRTQSAPSDTNTNTNAGTQPSTNTAAQPSNNQTNTAAQPSNNQTGTAQSRSSNVNISANLDDRQRTRVTESITKLNARPVENVNFSLSVGKVVPRDVRFQPLPADVVEVVPQYRGYNFFVVRDDIVIVDPSSYQIVDVLPRTGRATAAAPASRKMTFSDTDRAVIRKHARSARTEQRTTGSSTTSTRVRVGDRLPDSVEIRSFPEEVYRESPTLREYRYIERDNRTYVVEPHERTIIEEID